MQMMLYMNLMEKNSAVKGENVSFVTSEHRKMDQISWDIFQSRSLVACVEITESFFPLPVGLLLNMLGLDLEVEEVEDAILTVLVVADLEMIDGM